MNILYLSDKDPRDTRFGGAQRTYLIWKALQEMGNVYSIHFEYRNDNVDLGDNCWIIGKNRNFSFLKKVAYRVCEKFFNPFFVLHLWPVAPQLNEGLSKTFPDVKFDVVVCRYFFDFAELHLWNFPKIYVDFDDHPLEMFDSFKGQYVRKWLKPISRFIIKVQLRFIESKITGGWIANPEQVSLFHKKITALKNVALTPSDGYCVNKIRKRMLISVGRMSYYPNYSGVDKFLCEVWPTVRTVYPDIEFVVVGGGTPVEYVEKWNKIDGVRLTGFVDNLEQLYEDCLATVVPVYSGGGTCIKTLESLAYSRVCLSTPCGARGLQNYSGERNIGLFQFYNADDFLGLLKKNVLDDSCRDINEANAKSFIMENHSIESFKKTVINTLK